MASSVASTCRVLTASPTTSWKTPPTLVVIAMLMSILLSPQVGMPAWGKLRWPTGRGSLSFQYDRFVAGIQLAASQLLNTRLPAGHPRQRLPGLVSPLTVLLSGLSCPPRLLAVARGEC